MSTRAQNQNVKQQLLAKRSSTVPSQSKNDEKNASPDIEICSDIFTVPGDTRQLRFFVDPFDRDPRISSRKRTIRDRLMNAGSWRNAHEQNVLGLRRTPVEIQEGRWSP